MVEISLKSGEVALVDSKDFPALCVFSWYYTDGYASTKIQGQTIYMHRLIMNPLSNMSVDHIDRNGLNNQRANLRICSHSENHQNKGSNKNSSSSYRNVYPNRHRWRAQIKINGRKINGGTFDTEEQANQAAIELRQKYMPFSL